MIPFGREGGSKYEREKHRKDIYKTFSNSSLVFSLPQKIQLTPLDNNKS